MLDANARSAAVKSSETRLSHILLCMTTGKPSETETNVIISLYLPVANTHSLNKMLPNFYSTIIKGYNVFLVLFIFFIQVQFSGLPLPKQI